MYTPSQQYYTLNSREVQDLDSSSPSHHQSPRHYTTTIKESINEQDALHNSSAYNNRMGMCYGLLS